MYNAPSPRKRISIQRLVDRYPYVTVVVLLAILIATSLLTRFFISPYLRYVLHVPGLLRSILDETILTIPVFLPIGLLHWWPETGFTRGIKLRNWRIYIGAILLIGIPLLCGSQPLLARSTFVTVLGVVVLSWLIGIVE